MDNYLADFENNGGKSNGGKRGGGFKTVLLACLLCMIISAAVSVAVFSSLMNNNSLSAQKEPDNAEQQLENQEAMGLNINNTPVLNGVRDEATISVGKNVSPAVVFISNIQNMRSFGYYGWGRSFGSQEQEVVASTGSGVIYSAEGYIITNNHVVEGAERLSVTLFDGTSYLAEVIGRDERTDLAVIKIEPESELTVATFGDSDKLVVGETAIAIGNPGGENFTNSLTQGVISGLDRSISTSDGTVLKVVQTDAAINPGNSGGALCNARGEVIGINTIKISMTGYEGMGFAIPSNDVLDICKQLIEQGKVIRPALGVGIVCNMTPQLAYYNDIATESGVVIVPTSGGAAAEAGMKDYDVIVALDNQEVEGYSELQTIIFEHEIGDTVKVSVVRGQETLDFEVTLQELEN